MTLLDPRVEKHLIADQGEVVIDEVRKHWAAVVGAMLEMLGGVIVLLLTVLVQAQAWWVPAIPQVCRRRRWRTWVSQT